MTEAILLLCVLHRTQECLHRCVNICFDIHVNTQRRERFFPKRNLNSSSVDSGDKIPSQTIDFNFIVISRLSIAFGNDSLGFEEVLEGT